MKHPTRIEFMKLSLEERRKIFEEQSEKMKKYYEDNNDWREFQSGDFIKY